MADIPIPGTEADQLESTVQRIVDRALRESRARGDSTVSRRDIVVKSGGGIRVEGGGSVRVRDSGELKVEPGGAVRVAGPLDASAFYAGRGNQDGETVVLIQRGNGSAVFSVQQSATPSAEFWRWYSRNETELFSEDFVSGDSIARPYLPLPMGASVLAYDAPLAVSTSTSFAQAYAGAWIRQSPRIWGQVILMSDAATTGEVRLRVKGAVAWSQTFAASTNARADIGPVPWPTIVDPFERVNVELELRRASGTGAVRVSWLGAYGYQS